LIQTALYIHVPFCRQRCTYCDFTTWAHREELIRPYVSALCSELSLLHRQLPDWAPGTIYLGGGTPSLLPPDLLRAILAEARPGPAAEITLEANPGTLNSDALHSLRQMGVNRLSLGMQTSHPRELALLGRRHDFRAVETAGGWARNAGFDNLNLDLIYGFPTQSIGSWESSLSAALDLYPEHLSLYALSVEPATPLADSIRRGELPPPDPDLAADMYDLARERLADTNYVHYEISNWARPGHECRHNLAYWRNERYLGAGASAWGHWSQGPTAWRLCNAADPQDYLQQMASQQPPGRNPDGPPKSPACTEGEYIPRQIAMAETMFMGLRLVQEGVSRRAFGARFGMDPLQAYSEVLAELALVSLVGWDDERIYLRPEALLIANQVFSSFLPPEE
jgi:oxygen-independent coproporphyrinogen-3 oxidase